MSVYNDNMKPSNEDTTCEESASLVSADDTEQESQLEPEKNYSVAQTAHATLPPVMNAYASSKRFKSFLVCGATKPDALFVVEMHSGLSGRGPLGTRPGMYLHNGLSTKEPILAAAGDESMASARVYAFNNKSVIMLPRLPGDDTDSADAAWITEYMVGTIANDASVTFRFALNAGVDLNALKREIFEWRKFKKGTDRESPAGGFRLFRLPRPSTSVRPSDGRPGLEGVESGSPEASNGPECVATLEWARGWAKYWDHICTLKLAGSALSDELGERWKTMVIITALRLWGMRLHGKTKESTVRVGERIRGKAAG